jgi:hypothetical protein
MVVRCPWAFRQRARVRLGAAVAVIVVAVGLGVAFVAPAIEAEGRSPIYSLASLQVNLQRDPHAWLARTVRVHAVAVQCPGWIIVVDSCLDWQPSLADPHDASGPALSLVAEPASGTLSWLRSLPIIGGLVPQPQPIQWGVPADYTIRLQGPTCGAGDPPTCFVATIQDVAL